MCHQTGRNRGTQGKGQAPVLHDIRAGTTPARDLALYERLISDGIAAANSRGGVIDHVTARRMALWLLSQQQPSDFARGLIRFAQTGVVTWTLKIQLGNYARSPGYPHRSKAARLREYVVGRGTDLGPVSANFAAICDQIDQADTMLAGLRERAREGRGLPEPVWPDTGGQEPIVLARRDLDSRTITLIMDTTTANIAMHAIATHAGDREAHVREVEQYGLGLHKDSYGRRNRQAIAARETRIAARLRAVEHAYRTATDPDAPLEIDPTATSRSADMAPDYDLELE
jgi:hypothetical protein